MIRTTVGRATKSPAIAKAVAILDDLAHSNELGAISAIARRTGMAKSSVADICSALSALGLLSRGRDGRYLPWTAHRRTGARDWLGAAA